MSASPLSLAHIIAALRNGEVPVSAYVAQACDHLDAHEPEIGALLPEPGRRERLLRDAAVLETRYPDPPTRPPLYGVLVGVKDIIHVEGFPTGAGTALPPELFAGEEAAVVALLREAGALVLGKTVTTEFAGSAPNGTRNPRNLAHTPGGSSSGSAAAVAAGYCPLALGTQTVGSVIRPAAFCGVVGFKPTYGRIPTAGIVYYSQSVDTIGLFAPDVAGMAQAAAVLCEGWQPSLPSEQLPVLAVPDGPYLDHLDDDGRAAFAAQCAALRAAGYTVQYLPAFADFEAIRKRHIRMASAEAAQVHAPWFASHETAYRPETLAVIRDGQTVGADELDAGRAGRGDLRDALHALMDAHGVDLWVCPPATGTAPVGIAATGNAIMNLPWSHAGMPALTVPAGTGADDLPFGLQLVARAGADESLLAWAQPIAATVETL